VHSQPASGEELQKLIREMRDETKRLSVRLTELSHALAQLEARVAALE
jgi:hypothetical protein